MNIQHNAYPLKRNGLQASLSEYSCFCEIGRSFHSMAGKHSHSAGKYIDNLKEYGESKVRCDYLEEDPVYFSCGRSER